MLCGVHQLGKESFHVQRMGADHIENLLAAELVDFQCAPHHGDGRHDHVGIHRDDGDALPDAVAGLVLARSGVHAHGHADENGQYGGELEQLRGNPNAVANF